MSRYKFENDYEFRDSIQDIFSACYERTSRAKKILDEAINCLPNKLDENYISKKFNISKRWLQQECKKAYNISYKKLFRILRIYYAINLLYKTNLDNTQIAIEVSYTEESSMARDFRVVIGMNPGDVRIMLARMSPKELLLKYLLR